MADCQTAKQQIMLQDWQQQKVERVKSISIITTMMTTLQKKTCEIAKFVILGWQNTAEQADCDEEENAKCTHVCPCTRMCETERLAFI